MPEYKPTEFDHVEIKLDQWGKGSVIVNGHPLKSSLGVSVEANGGEITVVTLRLLASADVDVLVKSIGYHVATPMSNGSDAYVPLHINLDDGEMQAAREGATEGIRQALKRSSGVW